MSFYDFNNPCKMAMGTDGRCPHKCRTGSIPDYAEPFSWDYYMNDIVGAWRTLAREIQQYKA